jgi:nucleoside 2-deoxyribosyltransferase
MCAARRANVACKPEAEGPVIYLAAPLFSIVERRWNRDLAAAISKTIPNAVVILPQDFRISNRYNDVRHWPAIYRECIKAIDRADVLVAVVDGPDADSGTAFEMGYACKAGKPVVAVRTDFRQNQDRGLNIMLSQAADEVLVRMSFDEDIEKLAADISRRIIRVLSAGKKR